MYDGTFTLNSMRNIYTYHSPVAHLVQSLLHQIQSGEHSLVPVASLVGGGPAVPLETSLLYLPVQLVAVLVLAGENATRQRIVGFESNPELPQSGEQLVLYPARHGVVHPLVGGGEYPAVGLANMVHVHNLHRY